MTQVPPGEGADEFRLDGDVALVTGAGRGVGAGIAQAYARAGADLVLVARTVTDLGAVAAAVRASGRTALVIPADLRLDILVNNPRGALAAAQPTSTPPPRRWARRSTSTSPHRSNSPDKRLRTCSPAAAARWSASPREWTAWPPAGWSPTEPSRPPSPSSPASWP